MCSCVHSGDRAMFSSIDDVIFENNAYSGYQMARKSVSKAEDAKRKKFRQRLHR